MRCLGNLGRLVVSDGRGKRRHQHERAVERGLDIVFARNDAGDAIIGKAHDRIRHQPHRLQKIVSHHRIEDVELEMTLAAGHRDGHVIAEDLRANHCQGFALSGIYLARHDR